MLLAIDPGEHTGWALFNSDKQLVDCGLGDARKSPKFGPLVSVTIEQPVIYPRMKARPNDIVTLALGAGEWAGIFRPLAPVEYVEPSKWKGSVPKAKHQPRIWAKLTETEFAIVERAFVAGKVPKSLKNNVVDAVGIGLWKVKRLPR